MAYNQCIMIPILDGNIWNPLIRNGHGNKNYEQLNSFITTKQFILNQDQQLTLSKEIITQRNQTGSKVLMRVWPSLVRMLEEASIFAMPLARFDSIRVLRCMWGWYRRYGRQSLAYLVPLVPFWGWSGQRQALCAAIHAHHAKRKVKFSDQSLDVPGEQIRRSASYHPHRTR